MIQFTCFVGIFELDGILLENVGGKSTLFFAVYEFPKDKKMTVNLTKLLLII